MPIDSKHPQYRKREGQWARCQDAYDGDEAIKAQGVKYLPMLSGQSSSQYESYKQRSLFYGATARTIDGIAGAVMRKDPTVVAPDELEELLVDITGTGIAHYDFAKDVVTQLFMTSRVGILIDRPTEDVAEKDQRPYLALYTAQSIINWREDAGQLVLVVLNEDHYVADPADEYNWKKKLQFRELSLTPEGYEVTVHWRYDTDSDDKWQTETYIPLNRGSRIEQIPFVFISPKGTSINPEKPISLDLVDVNISHYRTMADLEHGRHFTALPTPWFSGVKESDLGGAIHIGSSKGIVLPDPQARAGYLEFKGDGLSTLMEASDEKKEMMAKLGARMLDEKRKAVETAETARIHASGEVSIATQVAKSAGTGISKALTAMAEWQSISGDIDYALNTDLIDAKMASGDLEALLKVRQAGEISEKSFTYNLQRGELLDPSLSADDERELLDLEGPGEGDENAIPE
jgi:hypothetical protein